MATQKVVVSVGEDLWLHDGHQAVLAKNAGLASSVPMSTISIITDTTFTCWQMLAYLASTLAFSAMARADGQPSEIFRTLLHLAKPQPSFLYWAQRSESPSRPAWRR